jgi:hypothetical protein
MTRKVMGNAGIDTDGFYAILTADYQVHLPASDSGRVVGIWRFGWLTFLYLPLGYGLFPYIASLHGSLPCGF